MGKKGASAAPLWGYSPHPEALPSQSRHLPKASPPSAIPLGVRFQHVNLEDAHTFRPQVLMPLNYTDCMSQQPAGKASEPRPGDNRAESHSGSDCTCRRLGSPCYPPAGVQTDCPWPVRTMGCRAAEEDQNSGDITLDPRGVRLSGRSQSQRFHTTTPSVQRPWKDRTAVTENSSFQGRHRCPH